jgi:hypothetical protein
MPTTSGTGAARRHGEPDRVEHSLGCALTIATPTRHMGDTFARSATGRTCVLLYSISCATMPSPTRWSRSLASDQVENAVMPQSAGDVRAIRQIQVRSYTALTPVSAARTLT